MNSLDLTLSAIKGIPEKIPFNPYIMHMAATLLNIDYNHEFCQKPDVLADAMIKCSDFFGIDHVNVSTDAYREANAWGVEIDWSSHTPIAKKYLEIDDFESIETPDILENIRIQNRVKAVEILSQGDSWDRLREEVKPFLRPPDQIRNCLKRAGAAFRAEDIGCSRERLLCAVLHAHEIRSRFTVIDLARLVGVLPQAAEEIVEEWS